MDNAIKNMTKETIFEIPIFAGGMEETLRYVENNLRNGINCQHVVVNAGKIVDMQTNPLLKKSILEADIVNADGMAVVWASRFLGKPLPERVAGIDLMMKLVEMAHKKGFRCYFLGAKDEVVKNVVKKFRNQYSEAIIAGYRNGYFDKGEEEFVVNDIANSKADLLFVAMSSPQKELFVNKYKTVLNIPFVMGVGGSFDVVAGITRRAPLWMQKIGLEWFYRLIQEPQRMWKRYLIGNSKFIWLVLKEKFYFSKIPLFIDL